MTTTQSTSFQIGQRVNHIGQRDAVYPRRAAEGTVTAFTTCATDNAVIVIVTWDHEGNDLYRPAELALAGAR